MMKIMNGHKYLLFPFFMLMVYFCTAQIPPPDKSPLDISYAPHQYPIQKFQGKQPPAMPLARVLYSRPQKNGRVLFGGEIKYNELWRLGANEATEIELFRNATVGSKSIPKGRYTLYCIPKADKWTLIFNKDNYSWGAFSYKQSNDVSRVDIPITRPSGMQVEFFTMYFDERNHLVILWDDVKAILPITFSTGR
jgi:hypothetical protein